MGTYMLELRNGEESLVGEFCNLITNVGGDIERVTSGYTPASNCYKTIHYSTTPEISKYIKYILNKRNKEVKHLKRCFDKSAETIGGTDGSNSVYSETEKRQETNIKARPISHKWWYFGRFINQG